MALQRWVSFQVPPTASTPTRKRAYRVYGPGLNQAAIAASSSEASGWMLSG
jgi:hypothetical protein